MNKAILFILLVAVMLLGFFGTGYVVGQMVAGVGQGNSSGFEAVIILVPSVALILVGSMLTVRLGFISR